MLRATQVAAAVTTETATTSAFDLKRNGVRKAIKGAELYVTAIAGAAPSVVVTVSYSSDGTNFHVAHTFTAATATGREEVAFDTGYKFPDALQYVRATATYGGTTTGCTYSVNLVHE